MISPDWTKQAVRRFGGKVDLLDQSEVFPEQGAIEAQNVRFVDGSPVTREPFHALFSETDVTAMFNWIAPRSNWLVYKFGTSAIAMNIPAVIGDASETSLGSGPASFAPAGERLYAAFASQSDGISSNHGKVWIEESRFGSQVFTGGGLNDATIGGTFTGSSPKSYVVSIAATGLPDTFYWSNDDNATINGPVSITAGAQSLGDGVTVTFLATSGHTVGNTWTRSAYLLSVDDLFSPPMTYTPSAPTEPGVGSVTAGLHRIGYIVETRSGFIGRPSPDSGSGTPGIDVTFQPIEFTASGGANLSITLNPSSWPADAKRVHIIMTTVDRPNLYLFVPGAVTDVPSGSASSKTFTISISDEDLLAQGFDATENLVLWTQTVGGAATITPHHLFTHGDRMVYIAREADEQGAYRNIAVISNRQAFQAISRDHSIVTVPGQGDLVTGFSLKGQVFLLGKNTTFVTQDNGLNPVEWPAPSLVDGRRGTHSIRGFDISPSGQYVFVACEDGLYVFDGNGYPRLPVSFYQSELWRTINWSTGAAQSVIVKDYAKKQQVWVMAPVGSATAATQVFVWDYTDGIAHDKVRFSTFLLTGKSLSCMELVNLYNPPSSYAGSQVALPSGVSMWVFNSTDSLVMADKMTPRAASTSNPYSDLLSNTDATSRLAIDSIYETGVFPKGGNADSTVYQFHGYTLDVRGAGTLALSGYKKDHSGSPYTKNLTLAASPGREYVFGLHQLSEANSLRLRTNAVASYFELSRATCMYSFHSVKR